MMLLFMKVIIKRTNIKAKNIVIATGSEGLFFTWNRNR